VTFEHDEIVPHASATVVLRHAASTDTEHLHLPGGHVGAMVSSSASKKLWPKMRAFWAARDEAGTKRAHAAPEAIARR
jgi:poly(3-hydroxyalkanoate) synthetase